MLAAGNRPLKRKTNFRPPELLAETMEEIINLLKKSGYSQKAIDYYTQKTNVGRIENPSAQFSFTGPCGDTMEIYLRIEDGIIKNAKFQAIGCAGAMASGSALTEMVKGKKIKEAKEIKVEDIISHLGGLPGPKGHCALLTKTTLVKALNEYQEE